MVGAIALLLAYQLAGELLVLLFGLPVPGPVIGMLLLFLTLLVRDGAEQPLRDVAQGLLSNLSLLFVPAGVGVMVHAGRISAEWLPILAGLVLGTPVTMAVTALVMRAAMPGGSDGR